MWLASDAMSVMPPKSCDRDVSGVSTSLAVVKEESKRPGLAVAVGVRERLKAARKAERAKIRMNLV